MNKVVKNAYAKINPALDVIRRREDGYHELRMIMQTVDIYDTIEMSVAEDGIELICDTGKLPCDEGNIVYRAAILMKEHFQFAGGVKIQLNKRIPMAAGMAGGSADAAATLHGINELFELNATTQELLLLGKKLGADVPYCVCGGTMLAEGIGEKLTPLPAIPQAVLVIAKPDFDVSTKYVYENLHANELKKHPDIDAMTEAIRSGNLEAICANMENVLETVTEKKYTEITALKNIMKEYKALNAMMSGSGPSVFGIFVEDEPAKQCAQIIERSFPGAQVFVTKFYQPV